MLRSLVLFSAFVALLNTAHAQEKPSAADYFDCDQTQFTRGYTGAVIEGKNYDKLYQIRMESTCRPKPGKGLYKDLPLIAAPQTADQQLKFTYEPLLSKVLGIEQKNIVRGPKGYHGRIQPYGTEYVVTTEKAKCDSNGANCKYPIRFNSTVHIETDGKSQLTVINDSDSITPLDGGLDGRVSGHFKKLEYNFTISRDVGGYRIHFESASLYSEGNIAERRIFNSHRDDLNNGNISQFEQTKINAITHLMEMYLQAYNTLAN